MPRPSLDEIFGSVPSPAEPQNSALPSSGTKPSLDEIFSKPSAPETSSLEALGRGGLQGATLGFGDELTGGIGALKDKLVNGDTRGFMDLYRKNRDDERAANDKAQKDHPYLYGGGQLAGGVGSLLIPGMGAAKAAGLFPKVQSAARIGAAVGFGNSDSDITQGDPDQIKNAVLDASKSADVSAAVPAVIDGFPKIKDSLADYLKAKAGNLAESATGATAAQAEKFRPGAGNELLDRKIVNFGSSPNGIAKNAATAMEDSENGISSALQGLDDKGVTVGTDKLKEGLQSQIDTLGQDESQAGVVKKLQGILDRLENTPDQRPISQVEQVKRGFQKQSNYAKPLSTQANKATASIYRQSVEDAATQADPALAKTFTDAKDTYGLLAPIQEAAERRATQLNQSPVGGFMDVMTAGGAAVAGHPVAGIPAAIARRVVSPRLASAGAVSLDKISDILKADPTKLGPFAGQLGQAAARGGNALAVTHYLLGQRNPEYQQMMQNMGNGKQDDGQK